MATEHQYFYEDEVFRINKKGNVEFGMVLENSELVSSDDNSDVEEGGKMKKGHIRVAWHPTGEEEVIPEKKVGLFDRSLMPGDVVRRMIKGKDTQRGYCRDIKVTACVQVVGSKHVICNVKSESLVPLEEFAADIAVCLDSWVGGIKMVHSKLLLQTSDGSRCIVNDPENIYVFDEKRDTDYEFPHRGDYYPGQTLWGPLSTLEDSQWIHTTKEMKSQRSICNKSYKTVKVMVEAVETESVGVHWQCRAYSKDGAGNEKEQPKFLIEGDDLKRLKLLNVFEPCTLQVGDRNFYVFHEGDNVVTKEHWRRIQKEYIVNNSSGYIPPAVHCNSTKKRKRTIHRTGANLIVKSSDDSAESFHSAECISPNTKREGRLADSNSVKSSSTDSSGVQVTASSLEISSITELDKKFAEPIIRISPSNSSKGDADWDTDSGSDADYGTDTCSIASSTASSNSSAAQQRRKGPLALMTKVLKKKKLRRARKKPPPLVLEPGAKLVVETLSTTSTADVVWQDGSVESSVPSTHLYPIHHLDDQEFFPGDIVIENREDGCMRVYGIVQSVDHAGRTASVKWFRTYTSTDNPQPTLLLQNEVSVYDLKDHPDFQYRPGTVVIRVANFEGEDASCTAGQVLDNYPEGRVRVWWVDGHISMCWPQDLYKVGEYDSDEGELWGDGSSEASWETESEDCCIADEGLSEEVAAENLKPKLAANIEKARIAMSRLEEIFTQNPSLQTTDVMRKLLDVYKDCRYLDKLMGTTFFHESHFQGLLERVRERGRANVAQRVADQVNRLFNQSDENGRGSERLCNQSDSVTSSTAPLDISPCSPTRPYVVVKFTDSGSELQLVNSENCKEPPGQDAPKPVATVPGVPRIEDPYVNSSVEDNRHNKAIENNSDNTKLQGQISSRSLKSCSINETSTIDNCCDMNNQEKRKGRNSENATDKVCWDLSGNKESGERLPVCNSHVCVKLCSLILAQLVEAHTEVMRRFGGNAAGGMTLSDAANTISPAGSSQGEADNCETEGQGSPELPSTPVSTNVPAVNGEAGASSTSDSADNMESELESTPSAPLLHKEGEGFSILDTAPNSHKFKLTMFQPTDPKYFFKTVRNEIKLLRTSLPQGIWVKGFEDRMDLYSVMIRGPEKTPYEDGLFFFDFQLSADYPKAPPLCHYVSYCSDRLNPNLYEDGKVCISLLGTWSGKGTEVWTLTSNLLQVIISIQGLILVNEPYFNEAGYEKQKGSQQGKENSRMYNEMVVLKLVQAMSKLIVHPPPVFKNEIMAHFSQHAHKLCDRLESWLEVSEQYNNSHPLSPTTPTSFKQIHSLGPMDNNQEATTPTSSSIVLPEFSLIPASKGFCLTLRKTLVTFREVLVSVGIINNEQSSS